MSSESLPPLPQHRIVLGFGQVSVDFLATVASFPNPDDKIRSTSFKVQGGGNAGNALTCAARLGLNPRLISKVANDSQGKGILEELEADGVNTSFFIVAWVSRFFKVWGFALSFSSSGKSGSACHQVSEEGNSPFAYVIVDTQTKSRTCIGTPGYPPLIPEELSRSSLLSALDGANMVYFDGRHPETALLVAKEAARKNIPILVEAERKREGLDDLLDFATYAVCSAKFPLAWTEAPSVPSALISMLMRLPKLKFVIVTLGEDGCIMLERRVNGDSDDAEEMDADSLLESLNQRKDDSKSIPTCISSVIYKAWHFITYVQALGLMFSLWTGLTEVETKLTSNGMGTVTGRLFVGTAEKIPPSELVDTTGAGDAFIGAVLYALCASMTPEKMLPFAAQVAAAGCRALGARADQNKLPLLSSSVVCSAANKPPSSSEIRDNTAKNVQLARLSREESLSNLKLRVNENKIIPVSSLRGIARLVICSGPMSFILESFKLIEPFTARLLERGVLVVPFATDRNSPSLDFDESEDMKRSLRKERAFGC
ncbi:Receptor serine/threonine-protein kinase ALE2 isoform 1 [Hibiscus syriacus]|uniref:Receptor serine/threonine-protein kinase ALE2 isoform 1 n=1 Tax=Hibiscus syriacus TaxID=106335 RepID=A0A6A2Z2P2_HIBSY|nr:Receptor serine/threonine-protein kinase ALE2 isoform 1 [Hibiscus syriacus]